MEKKQVLRLKEVEGKVGLKKSSIYSMVNKGYFPKPINLGARAVGWLDSEIDAWLAERMEIRNKG